jgi:acyl-CoA thioesterase-1
MKRLFGLLLVLGLVGTAVTASAAPLTTTPWCANHDSIALIGSSSGAGSGSSGYTSPDGTYSSTPYGWYARTIRQLSSQWGAVGTNYSRGGAKVSDFLPGGRWPSTTGAVADIGNHQPDLVLISLGTNEWYEQVPLETYADNLRLLIDNIRAASPLSAIMMMIQWEPYGPHMTITHRQYASTLYGVTVEKQGGLLDLRKYVPPGTVAEWATFYQADRGHLNDAGHMIVAGVVTSMLTYC